MHVIHFGAISYSAGGLMFLVLTVLLMTAWRGRLQGGLLLAAAAVSTVWCGALALHAARMLPASSALAVLEILRDGLWLAFLLRVLGYAKRDGGHEKTRLKGVWLVLGAFCVGAAIFAVASPHVPGSVLSTTQKAQAMFFAYVLLAVAGLALVEQLFRNTRSEHRWAIKFLCFGVGGAFAYDFFLYSYALLFTQMDSDLWMARGAINAVVVPLIAVSATRNPQWSVEIFVSRHVVFHSVAFLGAGLYLLLMAGAGFYIRLYGGTWGGAAEAVFLFGAVVLLLLLMFSAQLRARVKVFLGKHFYKNRYDYREEWLKFTRVLSTSNENSQLRENIIRAIADIVGSPGGALWVRQESGYFHAISRWEMTPPESAIESENSPLVRFMEGRGWVLFLDEYTSNPSAYDGLVLPDWLRELPQAWVVVPLMQRDELLGFVVTTRSRTKGRLNWEDNDLLKTAGRQAASYLALIEATRALTDARQFDAFNRLSSYVVHDLKNLVAQLSLVSVNARKHMHNPVFIADAVETVENVTNRMNRLLAQLRKGRMEETTSELVNLERVLEKVVAGRSTERPAPRFECLAHGMIVTADPDRLAAVLEHVVQNAQEATPPDGDVCVRLRSDEKWAMVEVQDTGCGMDARFISERLFRPFDTTKGNAGMGIGVYETREFARARGGDVDVHSHPDKGTIFRIRLPLENGDEDVIFREDPQTEVVG